MFKSFAGRPTNSELQFTVMKLCQHKTGDDRHNSMTRQRPLESKRSSNLDKTDRFEIGLYDFTSAESRSGFLSNGVMKQT